jgi:HTH-type transcriptional regulator / antitoxin HipB
MTSIKSCKDLGIEILKARKAQNLTQKKIAALCGFGERFIIDLEKGKPTCSIDKAIEVAQMLGIKLVIDKK